MSVASSLLFSFFLVFSAATSQASSTTKSKRTYIVCVEEHMKPSVFPTHVNWYISGFVDSLQMLHVYDTVFHGFSAKLTEEQVDAIKSHPSVIAAFEDRRRELHTTRSPQFLGLRNQHGLWSGSDYGSDVIVGILDTGIWPERRSFSDFNLGPVPSRWKGTCETGTQFDSSHCNKKLIGARFFSKGHEAAAESGVIGRGINRTIEFLSPRDADGHGTHTASTAAGTHAFQANMSGYASGIAKGVAPKARLAVYKVCWKNSGCFDSDILAGFDRAVSDGVDVISVSIGGAEGVASPYYLDPIAIGSFGAISHGVFVAASSGNDGPMGMSVTNVAPWLTTVGAGTIDRNFPADVILGDGRKLAGVSLYSGNSLDGEMFPLVYPGKSGEFPSSLCMEGSLDPKLVAGKIVVCDRGSNPRVAKGLIVKKSGGVGMILANGLYNGEGVVGDAHVLPACAIGANAGDILKAYIEFSSNATATIDFKGTMIGIKPAPVVATFSGRGPSGLSPAILKPDMIAPGVNILAAWTDSAGPTGLDSDTRKTEFNILSGTSMACPHTAGAAALLKSSHPDWSPSAIRSSMMTTASIDDNRLQPVVDESSGRASTPYEIGAGHLNLDRAMDPGLIYDAGAEDYVNFLCSIGYDARTIQVITRYPVTCPGKKPSPENFNYPSFSALFDGTETVKTKVFLRTVTNVGPVHSVYKSTVDFPNNGVTVTVEPTELVFSETVKKQNFALNVSVDAGKAKHLVSNQSGAIFGSLSWSDGIHVVRSPIVVSQRVPL